MSEAGAGGDADFPGLPDRIESVRRLAEHGPSALPAPPPGLGTGTPLLYLDQNVWVRMLRDGADAARQRQRLESAVEAGSVVVCLSGSHYAETWHRGDWRSRWRLARQMWDVSRLVALLPMHALLPAEIGQALRLLGAPLPEAYAQVEVLGTGVNHAFDSPTGRLRLIESLGPDGQEGPAVPLSDVPQQERDFYAGGSRAYEWFSLAGLPGDMRAQGLDLRTHRRHGGEFADGERGLAALLMRREAAVSLGEAVTGHDLAWIWGPLCDACAVLDVDPNGLLWAIAEVDGRAGVRRLIRSMPSFGLLHDLRVLRHENPQQPWHGNDRQDLLALSVAVVHCRAVVTERHWTHLLNRLDVAGRTGAFVTAGLGEALDRLGV